MNRQNPQPTLNDFMDLRINLALSAMNCITVGTIQAFNPTDQTATISINYKRVLKGAAPAENNIDLVDKIIDYPLLVKCPVISLMGGVAKLTFPIAVGDTCLVLFCDREIDTWFSTGSTNNPPASDRIHDLTDAVALVGIRSSANPLANFNTIIASLMDKTGERLSQAGDMKATARATAPSGWLLCYGQAVSRTTYDVLFAAIGTTWGAGDGSTTFNVPDYRGRTFVGLDNMGGSQAGVLTNTYTPNRNVLGGAVGEEAHQLTIPEMPIHTHSSPYTVDAALGSGGNAFSIGGNKPGNSLNNAGGDVAHNTVQPGRMCNIIIKY